MRGSHSKGTPYTTWATTVLGMILVLLGIAAPCAAQNLSLQKDGLLTAGEKDWLSAHQVITIAPDPDYPPIEFFAEDGTYQGIAADLVALVERRLGFRFRILRLNNWDEILEAAKTHEIDMFGAAAETPQRSEYMYFTSPFVDFPSVIIVRKSVTESLSPDQLSGMNVAVVSGYADHDYIINSYPQLKFEVVPTVEIGLRKVSFGLVDALITNLASATFYIEKGGITNLRIAGNTGYVYRLGFACRKDWPELGAILEKALSQISPDERNAIYGKWVHLGQASPFTKKGFWLSVSILCLVVSGTLIGVLTWNRSLKAVVRKRTEELRVELTERTRAEEALQKAHDQLEKRVEERTAELRVANADLQQEVLQRKRAQEALQTAHQQLQDIIEFLPDATFVIDHARKVIAWNRAIEEMTGVSKSEILGKGDFAYAAPFYGELRPILIDVVMDVDAEFQGKDGFIERKGDTVFGEVFVPKAYGGKGAYLWATASPLFDPGGTMIGAIETIRDITDRKESEKALRLSEERFRAIFESAEEFIFIKNTDLQYTLANPAVERIFGLKPSLLVGLTDGDLFGNAVGEQIREVDRRVLTGQIVQEERSKPVNGTLRTFHIIKVPMRDQGGNIIGLCGISRDITERKEAEEALQESEKQLRFLSSRLISAQEEERKHIARELHDSIGQSLAAVKFSVENVLKDAGEGGEDVQAMVRSLERLIPTIQDSIEEARRIYTGLRPSILDDLGIIATIHWVCREFQMTYPGICIESTIEAEEVEIPETLKIVIFRVMQEALNNVAKYSRADLVALSLIKANGDIRLTIEDYGEGFDLGTVLSKDHPERSLGLSGMKERTELSGGAFSIETTPGEGTRISASWPCS